MAQCASPAGMGRKGVSRCTWCAATATFAGSACVVCEKEGRLKSLWPLFYELGLYVGFSEAVHCL